METLLNQAAILDDNVYAWTELKPKFYNNAYAPSDGIPFISLDHLIVYQKHRVYTFHLKEHYWSGIDLEEIEEQNTSYGLFYVRPGLLVDFQWTSKPGIAFYPVPVFLTWETNQDGVPENFCQKAQDIDCSILKRLKYVSSVHVDETSFYIMGSDDVGLSNRLLYVIDLETFQISERITDQKSPCCLGSALQVLCDGKLFVFGKEGKNLGFWSLHPDKMQWEKLKCPVPSKFLTQIIGTESPYIMVKKHEILFGSHKGDDFGILSYDTKGNFWTDSFLLRNTPRGKGLFSSSDYFLVYKDSIIHFSDSKVYSIKNPFEPEKLEKKQSKENIERLLKDNNTPDVVFKVEDQEFPAHKCVLSLRSPYFKNAFSSNMMESHSEIIPIGNVKAKVFKTLLKYLYMEDFEIEDDILEDLFKLSHEYNLTELNNDCQKMIFSNISIENAVNCVLIAGKYEAEKLRKVCLNFIVDNLKEIIRTQNFRALDNETIIDLFELSNCCRCNP